MIVKKISFIEFSTTLNMNFKNVFEKIIVFLLICSTYYAEAFAEPQLDNPYRILGVGKKASQHEIRQVYKKLAKKWYGTSMFTYFVVFYSRENNNSVSLR